MVKVSNKQEQLGNINRDGNSNKRRNAHSKYCKMLNLKRLSQIKKGFNGLISKQDTAEEKVSDLEDRSIETSQIEMQREKIM